jgi:hypothetical protein
MKNTLLVMMSLLALNLVACPESNPVNVKDSGVADTSLDSVKPTTTVAEDTWELTLPGTWDKHSLVKSDAGSQLIADNVPDENLLVFTQTQYKGTLDQFAIESIRNLRSQYNTLDYSSSVVINGMPFVYVKTIHADSLQLQTWLTVSNDFGYSLSCGGTASKNPTVDCEKIVNSLQVK